MLSCGVRSRPYVPSSFEIEEYCKTERHRICPLYLTYEGGKLEQECHEKAAS